MKLLQSIPYARAAQATSEAFWPSRLISNRRAAPAAEMLIFKLLSDIGGRGTAAAICRASQEEIAQAAVHVLAKRLVQRGLLNREEATVEIEGEVFKRIIYQISKGETSKSSRTVQENNIGA
jgi:hypothetical protein